MPKNKWKINECLSKHLSHVDLGELVKRSDEELCDQAKQGCAVSRNLLWKRYQNFVQRIVYNANHHQHLPQHEMVDALSELYLAFHETVQRYDPESHSIGKSASFKTFLVMVTKRSFSNYCRKWRRYRQRVTHDLDNKAAQEFITTEDVFHFALAADGGDSLSLQMLLSELSSDNTSHDLSWLKPKEINLIIIWLQYGRDKEVAQALGISTTAAKLRRERLFRRLKQFFANE